MNIEQRSIKYVEFNMFETFDPVFVEQPQIRGLWHDSDGLPRYEAIVENKKGQEGNNISYLFPPFDPDSDEYDNYNFGDDPK